MKFKKTLATLAITGTLAGLSGCAEVRSEEYERNIQEVEYNTPEPSTIAFILTGAGTLGAYYLLERKKYK